MPSDPADVLDVFISYAHEDVSFRNQLIKHLSGAVERGGLRVWSDRQIPPGDPWKADIDVHLETSHIIVALVSSDFTDSTFCYRVERLRAAERHASGEARFFPVLIRPIAFEHTEFEEPQMLPRGAAPISGWTDVDAAWTEVVREILREGDNLRQARRSHAPLVWSVPPRPAGVAVPGTYFDRLWENFKAPGSAASAQIVLGPPRGGQVEAAAEFAWRHRADYNVVSWLRADDPAHLEADCAAFARRLHLGAQESRAVEAVRTWLIANADWLLVLEGAASPTVVRELVPDDARGHLLIATHISGSSWQELGQVMQIRGGTSFDAGPGFAAAPAQPAMTPPQADTAARKHEAYILRSISSTITRLAAEFPLETNLLNLLALLDPGGLEQAILLEGAHALPGDLRPLVADPASLRRAVKILLDRSLLEVVDARLRVPPLVRGPVLAALVPQRQRLTLAAAQLVLAVFPRRGHDLSNWARCEAAAPHARACVENLRQLGGCSQQVGEILLRLAIYTHAAGPIGIAQMDLQTALDLHGEVEADHALFARLLRELASVLRDLGAFTDSANVLGQALGIHRASAQVSVVDVADDLVALARTEVMQRKINEARAHAEDALQAHASALGADAVELIDDHGALAEILLSDSEIPLAVEHLQEARRILLAVYGATDPEARVAAGVIEMLRQIMAHGAVSLELKSVHMQLVEDLYGPNRRATADELRSLAIAFHEAGAPNQARDLLLRALSIHQHVYPPNHFEAANDLLQLFAVDASRDDETAAEASLSEAIGCLKQIAVSDRPAVIDRIDVTSVLERVQGPREGFFAAMALQAMEGAFGESIELVPVLCKISAIDRREIELAPTTQREGDAGRARRSLERALAIATAADDGLAESQVRNELASFNEVTDRHDEAFDERDRALRLHERLLRVDHPTVAADLEKLAPLLIRRGEVQAAQDAIRRRLEIFGRVFGSESELMNDYRVRALMEQGDVLVRAGELSAARESYEESLEKARATATPRDDAGVLVRLALLSAVEADPEAALSHLRAASVLVGQEGQPCPDWGVLVEASTLMAQVEAAPAFIEVLKSFSKSIASQQLSGRFVPTLSPVVPTGWLAEEKITLLSPDGKANIIASSEPLDESVDTERYSEEQGMLLRAEVPNYDELVTCERTMFGGRAGVFRKFRWTPPDSGNVTQIQIYYAEHGRGYTATVTASASMFPAVEAVLLDVLDGLVIRNRDDSWE